MSEDTRFHAAKHCRIEREFITQKNLTFESVFVGKVAAGASNCQEAAAMLSTDNAYHIPN